MKKYTCDICEIDTTKYNDTYYRRSGWLSGSVEIDMCKECAGKVLYFIQSLKENKIIKI